MSDNILLNKETVAGGDTSRFVDRTNPTGPGTAKTQVVMTDMTPAGAKETILGYPITIRTNITTSQSNISLVSISAGSKLVVTQIQCALDSNVSAPLSVIIGFGTGTTPTGTGVLFSHPNLAATGGIPASRGDGSGMIGMGTDSQGILITSGAPTGGSMDVVITYYVVPS